MRNSCAQAKGRYGEDVDRRPFLKRVEASQRLPIRHAGRKLERVAANAGSEYWAPITLKMKFCLAVHATSRRNDTAGQGRVVVMDLSRLMK